MRIRAKTIVGIVFILVILTSFTYTYIKYLELKEIYEKQFSGLYLYAGESINVATDLSRSLTDNLRYYILIRPPIYPAWQNLPPPGKTLGISNITFIPVNESSLMPIITNKSVDGVLFVNPQYIRTCIQEGLLDSFLVESITKDLHEGFRSPDGKWVTIAFRVYGLIVNRDIAGEIGFSNITSIINLYELFSNNPLIFSRKMMIIPNPIIHNTTWYVLLRTLELHGWNEGWKILFFITGVSDITNNLPDTYSKVALGLYGLTIGNNDQAHSAQALSGGGTDFILLKESIIEPLIMAPLQTPMKTYFDKLTEWFLSDDGQRIFLEYSDYIPVKKINISNWKIELLNKVEKFLHNNSVLDYYVGNDYLEINNLIQLYYREALVGNETYSYLKQIFNYLIKRNASFLVNDVLSKLASPLLIRDPFTGEETAFTYEYVRHLSQKLRELTAKQANEVLEQLRREIREAAIDRYKQVLSLLV